MTAARFDAFAVGDDRAGPAGNELEVGLARARFRPAELPTPRAAPRLEGVAARITRAGLREPFVELLFRRGELHLQIATARPGGAEMLRAGRAPPSGRRECVSRALVLG